MKNPYKFPARSRGAMIAALEAIGGRSGYPFAWNVKIRDWGDIGAAALQDLAGGAFGVPFNPAWDSAWRRHVESSDEVFWRVCEDAARYYLDGGYCTWPGDDQGDYEFELHGRSGGWLVLTKWQGISTQGLDFDDMRDNARRDWTPFGQWSFARVRTLYRAVMTMNQDFTPEKVHAEFRWHLAEVRAHWEGERREAIARAQAWQVEAAANARELLGELRAARADGAALVDVPAICRTIRAAIVERIALARRSRRAAAALIAGESVA